MNANRKCLGTGCFEDLWTWECGWKILEINIFIILDTAIYEASLNEFASYVKDDICLEIKMCTREQKIQLRRKSFRCGSNFKPSCEDRVRDRECRNVPVIWSSVAL